MTHRNLSGGAGWLAAGLLVLMTTAAFAGEDQPRKDDACTNQCDTESDKCMRIASRDKEKQKSCDASYEDCLSKCH
jgi:hypothetical protein